MLGDVEGFTNTHVARVAIYIRDKLLCNMTDGVHNKLDRKSMTRLGNEIHKARPITNLVEPFLGSWIHCPICFQVQRSKGALNQHLRSWHLCGNNNAPKCVTDWTTTASNWAMKLEGSFWCPLCEHSSTNSKDILDHLRDAHTSDQLTFMGFDFFLSRHMDVYKRLYKFYK